MDETNKEQATFEPCSMCRKYGCSHRHYALRWILGLIILAIVFWLGIKLGEFKGAFGGYYGGYFGERHMRFNRPMMYGQWGPGMMGNYFYQAQPVPQPTQPSTNQPTK